MASAELEKSLETDESQSVGRDSGDGDATGHKMDRRIVEPTRKKVAELDDDDHAALKKVIGEVCRHREQCPTGDVSHIRWRYSRMNRGNDQPTQGVSCGSSRPGCILTSAIALPCVDAIRTANWRVG